MVQFVTLSTHQSDFGCWLAFFSSYLDAVQRVVLVLVAEGVHTNLLGTLCKQTKSFLKKKLFGGKTSSSPWGDIFFTVLLFAFFFLSGMFFLLYLLIKKKVLEFIVLSIWGKTVVFTHLWRWQVTFSDPSRPPPPLEAFSTSLLLLFSSFFFKKKTTVDSTFQGHVCVYYQYVSVSEDTTSSSSFTTSSTSSSSSLSSLLTETDDIKKGRKGGGGVCYLVPALKKVRSYFIFQKKKNILSVRIKFSHLGQFADKELFVPNAHKN